MDTGSILFGISIALILGLISNRIIKKLHLPNVTAYLIVGILIGPYFFSMFGNGFEGILSKEMVSAFGIIVDVALGFIALSIGVEFKISNIKKLGKGIIVITLFQACAALIFVDVAIMLLTLAQGTFMENLPLSLTLGAIATATAPAATLMVIKQYKAKGPLTQTLLPVVAFDDAVGLILFSISFSVAQVLAKQTAGIDGASISVMNILVIPLLEIFGSIVVGLLIGLGLTLSMKFFKSRANRLMCIIAATFLGVALCDLASTYLGLEMSSLLTCMSIGAVFCNFREDATYIFDGVERWTPALFMLFFILSGSELDFSMISWPIMLICAVYLVARSLGKYSGARLGCKIAKTDDNTRKYLGFTLLPQAGVAIGMARSSSNLFASLAQSQLAINPSFAGANYLNGLAGTITAVVLTATLVYELVGPVVTKIALIKAGEIKKEKHAK